MARAGLRESEPVGRLVMLHSCSQLLIETSAAFLAARSFDQSSKRGPYWAAAQDRARHSRDVLASLQQLAEFSTVRGSLEMAEQACASVDTRVSKLFGPGRGPDPSLALTDDQLDTIGAMAKLVDRRSQAWLKETWSGASQLADGLKRHYANPPVTRIGRRIQAAVARSSSSISDLLPPRGAIGGLTVLRLRLFSKRRLVNDSMTRALENLEVELGAAFTAIAENN
jgi:hypothetical protein